MNSKSVTYLNHESATITLQGGPCTTFTIFGSPYSPAKDMWAFGYASEDAPSMWSKIPLDCDIVLTHTPPKYHLDERSDRRAAGCEALRQALWRVRPRLMVCGHIHESRGAHMIKWDLSMSNLKFKEHKSEDWLDPGIGNNKQSLIDLSSKSKRPLVNDGSGVDGTTGLETSRGAGGLVPSARCDVEALSGRMGRQETCIVNAAIMRSSWPHLKKKTFNKPIVVDIDLPVSIDNEYS